MAKKVCLIVDATCFGNVTNFADCSKDELQWRQITKSKSVVSLIELYSKTFHIPFSETNQSKTKQEHFFIIFIPALHPACSTLLSVVSTMNNKKVWQKFNTDDRSSGPVYAFLMLILYFQAFNA